jgi:phthiodiolone/phenolphthiodiolone dimycocerosates ketoreductase
MKAVLFRGTPGEVSWQIAEWRDQDHRYALVTNVSPVDPKLRKTPAASLPHTKVRIGFKKLRPGTWPPAV